MSNKHFISDPTVLVNSALRSLTLTNPSVAVDETSKIVYLRPSNAPKQVSIVSGGGSGHEPSFGAMVGPGMLTAAVAGTIFASPSTEQIRAAIQTRVDDSQGVLVTIMNYTGDVLNFAVAVEKARAAGVDVDMVVVGDDVGVGRAKGGKVGRRGIAGTVLVHKISGALAATGRPLKDVARVARLVADNLVTVGASLDHVHVPGRASEAEGDALGPGEIELGMGIHNEAGSGRLTAELPELVSEMLRQLLDQTDKDRAFLDVNSEDVVLMVNNLGGVSVLEMGGITTVVADQLAQKYGIKPKRILSGTYMTSLNGMGFSVTLLNTVDTGISGVSMIDLLDAPCEATGWTAPISAASWAANNTATLESSEKTTNTSTNPSGVTIDVATAKAALVGGLDKLVESEPEVTKYDTIVGDGDCGTGLKRGAEAVLEHINKVGLTGDAVVDLAGIVPVVEMSMDGTSGALFAIFLNSLTASLRNQPAGPATPQVWGAALKQSLEALSKYTPARPGDRTLIDALQPFVETLGSGSLKDAAEASRKGAESTKGMKPGLGRSVYVGGDGYQRVPDPGAWGLSWFFLGLAGIAPN
ncbi:Dihydroxyacetone kinase 1 [Ceratocystis lukuohia]|uniref:Dihydroxyacetone kinase 1 n=2 Tax=Ceratocystis TaxID=5157 RepID=A0A0F8B391_CERFI|nr:Dihydroxyacetone kinase 1 [Ceratocystis platani]